MKATRRSGLLLLVAIFTLSIILGATAPIYASPAGKTVTAVGITGNKTVPEAKIMAVVSVKPGETFDAAKVQQDMRAIYELGNFFDVVANFTEVPEGVKIVFTVMENPALQDVVIKGNTKVSTDKLRSLMTVPKGDVLNSKVLNDNARAIEQYYHDQGFVLARVSDVAISPEGVLSITINEGMLEGIVVKGNQKTKTNVITREMKIKPGEPFNVKDARRSMQKVHNLGFFEDVNMKLNPGKEPNAVVLQTDVVEQKTGIFSIGAGYSKADGVVGILELGDSNFRGTGDKIKVHFELGGNAGSTNYEFGYTRPWLDSKQTSLGFSIYNMTNQYSDYGYSPPGGTADSEALRSTYDRRRKGWDVTLGRPQGENVTNYITLKNRQDSFVKNVPEENAPVDYSNPADPWMAANPNYLRDNFGLTRSVTLLRVADTRDNVFNPTEGSRFSLSAEIAGKAFGGDFNFNKFAAEDRQYFKVGKSQVVALRLQVGYATGNMPDSGKFAVGGSETLRGYNDDVFKGNKMLAATVEYRFPVAKKVQGVVFGDIGNAWTSEGYQLDDLKYGIGVGVRVNTPIGPIRIDYARGENGSKTHFGFGGQF